MSVDFETLAEALQQAGVAMGAAEVHGALCGCLTMAETGSEDRCLREIIASEANNAAAEDCREILSALYVDTQNKLQDPNLSFQLLLPTDETALGLRVEALGEWCYGFSAGLVLAGLTPDRLASFPEQLREFLDDVSQIAQVSPEMVAYDESEADYAELIEYVRMGVVSLFEELNHQEPLPVLH